MKPATRPAVVLAASLLLVFPWLGEPFYVQLVTKIMILAIFALSLDLLVGYAGLVSLGHAAFFGLAGYVVAALNPALPSLWLTLPAAIGACAGFALLTGFLVLRTSGVYFIMVTLAFAQMLYFVFHDTALGGGADGIYLYGKPQLRLGSVQLLDLDDVRVFYWFVLAALLAVYGLLRRVLQSPFGHALVGIRSNETRMQSLGFPSFRYKLAAYVLSGALAGLAGYLAAIQFGFVSPELLGWHTSGNVLMMVILGGMGSLHGAVIGAFVFELLRETLSNQALFGAVAKHWQLAMGLCIMAVALLLPQGLTGWRRRPCFKPKN
jgi:branched-chain amino acid transport system permease protein